MSFVLCGEPVSYIKELSEAVQKKDEPVCITKDGVCDMVVMRPELYERLRGKQEPNRNQSVADHLLQAWEVLEQEEGR